tara:strand:+ start:2754 stop:3017 length:264 start_codon:yes stop_codon:yes gene_type:complete
MREGKQFLMPLRKKCRGNTLRNSQILKNDGFKITVFIRKLLNKKHLWWKFTETSDWVLCQEEGTGIQKIRHLRSFQIIYNVRNRYFE